MNLRLAAAVGLVVLVATIVVPTPAATAQATPNVVISEIHYHPQAVGTAFPDFDDREDTEFIEIVNLESTSVDLSGWCLDDGVDYCFPAGTTLAPLTTLVVADDAAAFDALYGFMPGAVYGGRLSNGGEQVRLVEDGGAVVADVTWGTSDPWPVTPDGNGPSLELVSAVGDLSSPSNWAASAQTNGSPGAVPTLTNAAPPLVISRTGAELVNANESIPVTATAVNTSAMTLVYNVDHGSNQTITMNLVGGVWQATLPALSSGGFIQYRFQATGPGGTTTSPRADDGLDWWAVGVASAQPHSVPVLDLFFSPQDWADIDDGQCGCLGAVAYEGRIWTDVEVRRAGSTSLNAAKANLRLDFPDGYPFQASFIDGVVDELTLDGGTTNKEMMREQLSWQLMTAVGFPPIRTQHVRAMQSGNFQGLYLLREEQDGNWRARNGLDRGLMYKVEGSADTFGFSGEHEKKEGFDEPDTDMFTLRACLDEIGAPFRACVMDQMDIPQLVNEIAATAVIRNIDQREFNYFIYRDSTQNGLWRMLPDDLDRTWGIDNGSNAQLANPVVSSLKPYARCIGTDTTPANEICRALMRWPEFEEMYNRRLRTLVDEVLDDPSWQVQITGTSDYIAADWEDDEAKWNRTNVAFSTMALALNGWVDDYVAHQRSGGHDGLVPGAQTPAPQVTISDYRSDPGDGLGYVMISNPSPSESVDLSNWTFDGLAEIPVGLVVLPGATVAVSTNDQMFRAMNPLFTGIRATTDGTIAGQVTLNRRDGSSAATVGQIPPAPMVLNEWNAVSSLNTLANGDATLGTIPGNGGDWFELVVIDNGLDIRGWRLVMSDNDGPSQQVTDEFVFTNDPLLAALEGGTIITVSEDFVDDVEFLPAFDDWHLNLQANSADDGAYFTAASQSNFSTNSDNWQLSIFDAQGNLVFGPAGEGIGATSGVNSSEIGELQTAPSNQVNPLIDYDDGDGSTFGTPNTIAGVPQDFSALRYPYVRLDVNCSGITDIGDALRIAQYSVGLLDLWSQCPLANSADQIYAGAADVDGDGFIDIGDSLLVAQCTVGLVNVACPAP